MPAPRLLSFAAALGSMAAVSCTRNPSPVRDPEPPAPAFLGELSGVYQGVDEQTDSRIVLVQLGDEVLMTPMEVSAGAPKLSIFATVLNASADAEGTTAFNSALSLVLPHNQGDFPPQAVCRIPGQDALTFPIWLAEANACFAGGSCDLHCMVPNLFQRSGIRGACLDDPGTQCRYEIALSGRLARGSLELYFDQESLVPPAGPGAMECPARTGVGPPWVRCIRFAKLCDFDSRLAGVYNATLTLDPEASTGVYDGAATHELELAVAVANHLPAVIFFITDPRLGTRVSFGPLNLTDLSFATHDGAAPGDPEWQIREGRDPQTSFTGRLTERDELVVLSGTWTETTAAGSAVYELEAERLSGVAPGEACGLLGTCERAPVHCPLGIEDLDRPRDQSRLVVNEDFSRIGCPRTSCERTLSANGGLCDPDATCATPPCPRVPHCAPDALEFHGVRPEILVAEWQCPDGGTTCRMEQECLRLRCHEPADGAVTSANWFGVGPSCDSTEPVPMNMHFERDWIVLDCDDRDAPCASSAVECPLPQSSAVQTSFVPSLDYEGCIQYACVQTIDPAQACADLVVPDCGATGEEMRPAVRPATPTSGECVELVCAPPCGTSCGGCGDCPSFDLTSCGNESVRVVSGCGGCPQLECTTAACATAPLQCPIMEDWYAYHPDLSPVLSENGCLSWRCEQSYLDGEVMNGGEECDGTLPPSAVVCPAGSVVQPRVRDGAPCIEYTCGPSCLTNAQCEHCECDDPAIPDSCGPGEAIRLQTSCGCLRTTCGAAP